jgi:hypothetical protein
MDKEERRMRRGIIPVFLLLLGIVGASTAWAEPPTVKTLVTNTPAAPVPTVEQNLDANGDIRVHEQGTVRVEEQRVPFQESRSWDDWAGGDVRSFTTAVPVDKMLVLQTVSVSVLVEPGQDVQADVVAQGASLATHPIPLAPQGTFGGLDLYVGTVALTAYAKGSGGVLATVLRNSTSGNGGSVQFSLSGYVVDAP